MAVINKLDGSGAIEINYVDAHLKMACDAESRGFHDKSVEMLRLAILGELWLQRNSI
jgi:hypothetical protein